MKQKQQPRARHTLGYALWGIDKMNVRERLRFVGACKALGITTAEALEYLFVNHLLHLENWLQDCARSKQQQKGPAA